MAKKINLEHEEKKLLRKNREVIVINKTIEYNLNYSIMFFDKTIRKTVKFEAIFKKIMLKIKVIGNTKKFQIGAIKSQIKLNIN